MRGHAAARESRTVVITKGGTYTGDWSSGDPNVPAVSVETTEPVVLENAVIHAQGELIRARAGHARLTVRNCVAAGSGRFLAAQDPDSLVVEHNEITGTGGIYVLGFGDPTPGATVKVVANRAKNIDGRRDGTVDLVQFLQLDKVRHVPGVEVAWNQVVNEPGRSRVEDVISVYLSGGTPDSPLSIHDNYIQGATPPPRRPTRTPAAASCSATARRRGPRTRLRSYTPPTTKSSRRATTALRSPPATTSRSTGTGSSRRACCPTAAGWRRRTWGRTSGTSTTPGRRCSTTTPVGTT